MLKQKNKALVYIPLLLLLFLLPVLITDDYVRHVLVMTIIFAIFGLSYQMILGNTGQFPFGHNVFFGVAAYTSAILSAGFGMPVWLCMVIAVVAAMITGISIGFIVARMRGAYLAIFSMSFAIVLWIVSMSIHIGVVEGMGGISSIPRLTIGFPSLGSITVYSPFSYYYLVLVILLLTLLFLNRLSNSRFGISLAALRENEDKAMASGINTFKHFYAIFIMGAAFAGVSGALYTHYTLYVSPAQFSMSYMWMLCVIVIVGGSRNLMGPIIGSIIFVLMPELLRWTGEIRLVLFGAALILCIIFMPQGIYVNLKALWRRLIARITQMRRQPSQGMSAE